MTHSDLFIFTVAAANVGKQNKKQTGIVAATKGCTLGVASINSSSGWAGSRHLSCLTYKPGGRVPARGGPHTKRLISLSLLLHHTCSSHFFFCVASSRGFKEHPRLVIPTGKHAQQHHASQYSFICMILLYLVHTNHTWDIFPAAVAKAKACALQQ